jgi:hypothetical protein
VLLDVTPIISTTACHQRNYVERYSSSPFAVEKVPTLNLHGVLCGPEGKSYALLSQVVILWYEFNSERG